MTAFISAAMLALCYLLQTTVVPRMFVGVAWPDLLLAALVCSALVRGAIWGATAGLVCGLLLDAQFTGSFGLYTLMLGAFGTVCGFVTGNKTSGEQEWARRVNNVLSGGREGRGNAGRILRPLLMAAVCAGLKQCALFVSVYFLRMPLPAGLVPLSMLLNTAYTAIAALVLYQIFYAVNRVRLRE